MTLRPGIRNIRSCCRSK